MNKTKYVDPFRNEKIAKIKIAVKQLDLTDDDYRAILKMKANVTSCKDAGPSQLDEILRHLKGLGFKPVRRKSGTKTGGLIRTLWKEHSREKTDVALYEYIRKCLTLPENVIKDPDHLTKKDADIIMGALRDMAAAARKEAVKQRMRQ